MSDTLTYQHMGTAARGQTHALFAQTMGYVAATAALFALGAWLGRNLTGGVGIVAFIAAFACLIAMRFAARRSTQLTVGLLAAFGLLIGVAVAPIIAYYGSMDPRALWEAGGATALFIAGFGAARRVSRRFGDQVISLDQQRRLGQLAGDQASWPTASCKSTRAPVSRANRTWRAAGLSQVS